MFFGEAGHMPCRDGSPGSEMDHGLFQAREIQREHREYLADLADGRAGIPEGSREGIEPGGMAECLGEKLQPLNARLLLPVFDGYRSVHSQQFFGGHAGVADKDQASLRVAPQQNLDRLRTVASLGIAPDPVTYS